MSTVPSARSTPQSRPSSVKLVQAQVAHDDRVRTGPRRRPRAARAGVSRPGRSALPITSRSRAPRGRIRADALRHRLVGCLAHARQRMCTMPGSEAIGAGSVRPSLTNSSTRFAGCRRSPATTSPSQGSYADATVWQLYSHRDPVPALPRARPSAASCAADPGPRRPPIHARPRLGRSGRTWRTLASANPAAVRQPAAVGQPQGLRRRALVRSGARSPGPRGDLRGPPGGTESASAWARAARSGSGRARRPAGRAPSRSARWPGRCR